MTTPPLYRSRPSGFDIKPAQQSEARRINDFIYLSEGLSNSYLIVTAEGRIVINTGMGFEAPIHRKIYDAIDDSPIRYVLLTQGHVDHVGGAGVFVDDGTELIAQSGNAAHQEYDRIIARFRGQRSFFAFAEAITVANRYVQKRAGASVSPQATPIPSITFDDSYGFELGGLEVELISTPGGETLDSMVIWLPQHRICFTGNLFSALFGHFPNLVTIRGDKYRDALGFLRSLEIVRSLEPEMLLVGHHHPVVGSELIQSELQRLRGAVRHVHDEVVKGMNEGATVEDLMRDIALPPECEVGEGYGKVSWSVRAIWENYAGWFHHRSTTELYATPAASIHGDLVELAGGPNAIAERALKRSDSGAPLEAIHLAEVALAADPSHRGALEASRAAHRQLLEASVNFWESAWLKKELRELEAVLKKEGN